jgi:hypothetical protein
MVKHLHRVHGEDFAQALTRRLGCLRSLRGLCAVGTEVSPELVLVLVPIHGRRESDLDLVFKNISVLLTVFRNDVPCLYLQHCDGVGRVWRRI